MLLADLRGMIFSVNFVSENSSLDDVTSYRPVSKEIRALNNSYQEKRYFGIFPEPSDRSNGWKNRELSSESNRWASPGIRSRTVDLLSPANSPV